MILLMIMMLMLLMMMMVMMMMTTMMMMRRPSSLRVRAKPRHLPYTYIDPSIDPLNIQKNTTAISGNPRGPQLSAEPKPELLPGGADRPTWEKLVIPKIFWIWLKWLDWIYWLDLFCFDLIWLDLIWLMDWLIWLTWWIVDDFVAWSLGRLVAWSIDPQCTLFVWLQCFFGKDPGFHQPVVDFFMHVQLCRSGFHQIATEAWSILSFRKQQIANEIPKSPRVWGTLGFFQTFAAHMAIA